MNHNKSDKSSLSEGWRSLRVRCHKIQNITTTAPKDQRSLGQQPMGYIWRRQQNISQIDNYLLHTYALTPFVDACLTAANRSPTTASWRQTPIYCYSRNISVNTIGFKYSAKKYYVLIQPAVYKNSSHLDITLKYALSRHPGTYAAINSKTISVSSRKA